MGGKMLDRDIQGRIELIIIGGGIAGAAAALRAAQNHLRTIWILGDAGTRKASRAAYVRNIDNMIGVHPDIVRGKVLKSLSRDHPVAARIVEEAHMHISTSDLVENARERIVRDFAGMVTEVAERVIQVRQDGALLSVEIPSETRYVAPAVILATGVSDRQPVVHRQKGDRTLAGIHWLFPFANQETLLYCIRCEGHMTHGRTVAVIGAGATAAEVSLMIRERYDAPVTLLTAGEEPTWGERRQRLLAAMDVEVVAGRLVDVRGQDKGATLRGFTVEGGRNIDVELAFVVMGLYRVAHRIVQGLGVDLEENDLPEEERHVLVDADSETSVGGLFAVGDMTRHSHRPIMKQVYTAQEYAVRAVDKVDARRRQGQRRRLLGEE